MIQSNNLKIGMIRNHIPQSLDETNFLANSLFLTSFSKRADNFPTDV